MLCVWYGVAREGNGQHKLAGSVYPQALVTLSAKAGFYPSSGKKKITMLLSHLPEIYFFK